MVGSKFFKLKLKSLHITVDSIISKCATGQRKHVMEALQYKRFQKIIDAMNVAKSLIADEISKRG